MPGCIALSDLRGSGIDGGIILGWRAQSWRPEAGCAHRGRTHSHGAVQRGVPAGLAASSISMISQLRKPMRFPRSSTKSAVSMPAASGLTANTAECILTPGRNAEKRRACARAIMDIARRAVAAREQDQCATALGHGSGRPDRVLRGRCRVAGPDHRGQQPQAARRILSHRARRSDELQAMPQRQ